MNKFISELEGNGKFIFSRERLQKAFEYYNKVFHHCLVRLCDMNYTPTMSEIDDEMFRKAFFEEYPDIVPDFINNTTGELVFTPDMMRYVSKLHGGIAELDIYAKYLKTRDSLLSLYVIASEFRPRAQILKYNCQLIQTANGITTRKNKMRQRETAYVRALNIPEGYILDRIDLRLLRLGYLLKALGHDVGLRPCNESVLLGGDFRLSDDARFLDLMIDGTIVGDGRYFIEFRRYVDEYNRELGKLDFKKNLFLESKDFVSANLDVYRTQHQGYKSLFLTDDYAYFGILGSKSEVIPEHYFIGRYMINGTLQEQLHGSGGEFSDKYISDGLPQESGYPSWAIPGYVCGEDPKPEDLSLVLGKLNCHSLPELVGKLSNMVYGTDSHRVITVGLIIALICSRCDVVYDKDYEYPNEVLIPKGTSVEEFNQACLEAETIYRSLRR